MKKRIRIITYCTWSSIGSMLQSFALSKTLKKTGIDNTVWLEEWNRVLFRAPLKTLKDWIKWLYKLPHNKKTKAAHQKRINFVSEHINAEYFPNYQAFEQKAFENREDIYLSGSDQVWNPDICSSLFFLDFAKESKHISYAASMGKTELSPEKERLIKEKLGSFEKISVREQECADVLQKLTDKEISVHIDPTFLLSAEEWRALEKSYKVKGPYILLYMLYWNKDCKKQIKELKRRTGLSVYAICSELSRVYADKRLYDVGVEEFLWLVDHAEYVVTSSFHGVALSTIFQKRFAAVINSAIPSRIEHLMRLLELPHVKINELDQVNPFDYNTVCANIEKERRRSIKYLQEVIE